MTQIALQIDHPSLWSPVGDSTLALGLEAQKRSLECVYYLPETLSYSGGRVMARGRVIRFFDDLERWYEEGEESLIQLDEMAAVLIRQDPPFDRRYITTTYLLEALPESVKVLNSPAAVRNLPEKWWSLNEYGRYMPRTLVTRDAQLMREFVAQEKQAVLKPFYGYGGKGVFLLKEGGENIESLIEHALFSSDEPWCVQQFLPDVATEDRRVIMMGGKVSAVLGRIPAEGEIRANFRVGGTGSQVELTPKQQEICDCVGEGLIREGVLFAGLDLIGDYLTEINITSPTGIRIAQKLYDVNPAADFWDAAGF